jgi:hypothetical protein
MIHISPWQILMLPWRGSPGKLRARAFRGMLNEIFVAAGVRLWT